MSDDKIYIPPTTVINPIRVSSVAAMSHDTATAFRSDVQSANSQLIDQINSLKAEVSSLRTKNHLLGVSVADLHSVLQMVYDNQNVHAFPAELRDKISRVLIECRP